MFLVPHKSLARTRGTCGAPNVGSLKWFFMEKLGKKSLEGRTWPAAVTQRVGQPCRAALCDFAREDPILQRPARCSVGGVIELDVKIHTEFQGMRAHPQGLNLLFTFITNPTFN